MDEQSESRTLQALMYEHMLMSRHALQGSAPRLRSATLERSAAVLMLANAVVNAAVCAVLIHRFGLTGAAVGAAGSIVLWNAAMALLVRRLLRVTPSALPAFRLPMAGKARGTGARPA